mgnify:CR=1 FL=1
MSAARIREGNLIELTKEVSVAEAQQLQSIARSLHWLDEVGCNIGLTPRQEMRETRLETQAASIAEGRALAMYRQRDPRGWPLYLYDPKDARLERYGIDVQYDEVGIGVCPR